MNDFFSDANDAYGTRLYQTSASIGDRTTIYAKNVTNYDDDDDDDARYKRRYKSNDGSNDDKFNDESNDKSNYELITNEVSESNDASNEKPQQ